MGTFKVVTVSGVQVMIIHADDMIAASETAKRRGYDVLALTDVIVVAD